MKKAILILLVFPFITKAQNFVYDVQLKEVSFAGSGYLSIKQDDGSGAYSAVHWNNTGTKKPVAYKSGFKPNVTARIVFTCSSAPSEILVKAIAFDTFTFAQQNCALTASGGTYTATYTATDCDLAFRANKVDYFQSFDIDWLVSFDGGTTWRNAGMSSNPLYVSWHAPVNENAWMGYEWFETLFFLSCKNAAGQTDEDSIIARVWDEFIDNEVSRVDGTPLAYYKHIIEANYQTSQLLADAEGQCYCFARLFMDLLKIQGISRTNNYLNIAADGTPSSCGSITRFLVKDWAFHTPMDSMGCTDLPWRDVSGTDLYTGDTSYLFDYTEVTDELGVKGQHAQNPSSLFNNHQIILIDGVYYDPSYGLKYNTIDEIRTVALSGWANRTTSNEAAEGIDVNGDSALSAGVSAYRFRITNDVMFANFDVVIDTY